MSRDSRLWLAEEVGAGAADHLHRVCPLVVVTVTSSRIRESTRRVSRLFLTFDLCLVSSAYIHSQLAATGTSNNPQSPQHAAKSSFFRQAETGAAARQARSEKRGSRPFRSSDPIYEGRPAITIPHEDIGLPGFRPQKTAVTIHDPPSRLRREDQEPRVCDDTGETPTTRDGEVGHPCDAEG
jgi:hypothetical protein